MNSSLLLGPAALLCSLWDKVATHQVEVFSQTLSLEVSCYEFEIAHWGTWSGEIPWSVRGEQADLVSSAAPSSCDTLHDLQAAHLHPDTHRGTFVVFYCYAITHPQTQRLETTFYVSHNWGQGSWLVSTGKFFLESLRRLLLNIFLVSVPTQTRCCKVTHWELSHGC